jgi:hypothetical protein
VPERRAHHEQLNKQAGADCSLGAYPPSANLRQASSRRVDAESAEDCIAAWDCLRGIAYDNTVYRS